ncbi:HU family DNA-binding protein [Nitrosovibrio tenuis]
MCERAARAGRIPKPGKNWKIAASKVPAFKPAAMLKAAVDGSGK